MADTDGALELAQAIFATREEKAKVEEETTKIEAQRQLLDERHAVLVERLKEFEKQFSRLLINGAAPAASRPTSPVQAPEDDDQGSNEGDGGEDDDDASVEENESQRAQVLAFYESQPGKKIPLPVAISKLPGIPEKAVRSYSSKYAKPGGPLKRVRRGVYKYVGTQN